MEITWIDADALWGHLDGATRVTVMNEAGEDIAVMITAVAVAFHAEEGAVDVRRATDLALDPGDSVDLADESPPATPPLAVEAMLRVVAPASGVVAEIYLRSDESRTVAASAVEIAIVPTAAAPAAGAVAVPEIEGLSAYIKLEP